jgi:succinate dehydrogenase hydrophobic anchor subunit
MIRDAKLWTWHVGAGLVILVFLGLHMVVMHMDAMLGWFSAAGTTPIDWVNVVERGRSVFFAVSYVVLLGAALFHGLYGLRNIVLELDPPAGLRKAVGVVLGLVGVGMFVFGTWAALASFTLARSL